MDSSHNRTVCSDVKARLLFGESTKIEENLEIILMFSC